MKFTELTTYTTTEGSEIVADIMWDYTNYGVAVLDKNDILELRDKGGSWDYIDESLLEGKEEALVKCFIPSDISAAAVLDIADALYKLKENSKDIYFGSLETSIREVDGDEWRETWKEHYRPIPLGDIVICPEWIDYNPKANEKVVKIDSNMAFGTGEHETTCMCVELIQKYVKPGIVLDIGTGSGILAISALKLGAKYAYMTDIDYVAVVSAKRNLKNNGLEKRATVIQSDLTGNSDIKGDLVTANITADVLLKLSESINRHLKEDAVLILSGIILSRAEEVLNEYIAKGFKLLEAKKQGEWCAFAFTRQV